MRRAIPVTMAAGLAAGLVVAAPTAASADQTAPAPRTAAVATTQAGDVSPMKVHRKYRKCTKPKGKRFNISWSVGDLSTTFYFNNHCKGTNRIKVSYLDDNCVNVTVKPGVKGSKRLWLVKKSNIRRVGFGKCPS